MAAITRKTVQMAQDLANESGKLEEQIVNRIDEIIKAAFKIFGVKLDTWYFYGAGEGSVGDLWRQYDEKTINIVFEVGRNSKGEYDSGEMVFIDKFGDEYAIDSEIPTRWLYDDDFEKEIISGIIEYGKREAERKAKQKELNTSKKLEDKQLIEAAKKKLSKKELAAIRRSL